MSEVEDILSEKILTRNMRKKIQSYIKKHSMSIEDFPEKFRPQIADILMGPKSIPLNTRKRKTPDSKIDNKDAPATKKQRRESKELTKMLINMDRENRKRNNIFSFILPFPILDITSDKTTDLVIIDDDGEDTAEEGEPRVPLEEDTEEHDEKCECERCDPEYEYEEEEEEDEEE